VSCVEPSAPRKLTNGTAYTFAVSAVNAAGTSAGSAASNQVTPNPATVPGRPTIGTATAGNTAATVTWTAPNDGGSPITRYRVIVCSHGALNKAVNFPAGSTTQEITGLTNGTPYTFRVRAINDIGTSLASGYSNEVTPSATP